MRNLNLHTLISYHKLCSILGTLKEIKHYKRNGNNINLLFHQKAYINKNNFLIHFVTLINSIYFQNIDSVRKGVTV